MKKYSYKRQGYRLTVFNYTITISSFKPVNKISHLLSVCSVSPVISVTTDSTSKTNSIRSVGLFCNGVLVIAELKFNESLVAVHIGRCSKINLSATV